jgi:hypothetical protein
MYVLGLGLLIWELQQNREAIRSQLTSDSFVYAGQQNATIMGEDLALVIAKACETPEDLTTSDLVVLEAHIEERANYVWRIHRLSQRGSFYEESDILPTVDVLYRVLSTHPGRTYWPLMTHLPSSLRAAVDERLSSVMPCDQHFSGWRRAIADSMTTAEFPE